MSYLFDYVERERASFAERPFGPVDAAVLTQAGMIDGAGIVPEPPQRPVVLDRMRALLAPDAGGVRFEDLLRAECFDRMFTGLAAGDVRRLLYELAASPRFRDLRLRGYRSEFDESAHTQFAAMSFTWGSELSFISFRGTDASPTGWRENFDMAYKDEVCAQALAREYVEFMAPRLPGELHVGGHSKGGNLALYAALTCTGRVQSRIGRIWCLDAPGFRAGRFSERDYARLEGRVCRMAPQDSIVGALLECPVETRTVRSSAIGLYQHSVFSWEIADDGVSDGGVASGGVASGGAALGWTAERAASAERDPADFVYLDGPSEFSHTVHEVVSEWLASMDDGQIERAVDALFAAYEASGARDVGDVLAGGGNPIHLAIEAARNLDGESSAILSDAFGELAAIAARHVGRDVAESLFGMRI